MVGSIVTRAVASNGSVPVLNLAVESQCFSFGHGLHTGGMEVSEECDHVILRNVPRSVGSGRYLREHGGGCEHSQSSHYIFPHRRPSFVCRLSGNVQ
jgi:hypothetical protein